MLDRFVLGDRLASGVGGTLENGRLSVRYRIGIDTGCIVSNRRSATVISADITCITAGSSTVDGSHYIWWSEGVQALRHPPAAHACVRAVLWSMIRERVGGEGGGRRLCHGEAGIRLQRRHSTGLGHHHAALPPPAGSDNNNRRSITLTFLWIKLTSHKTDLSRASLFVANRLHVPPIAYKLCSLSDLPCLILQVAGTPTHGVLVSVSASAVVYTRILVSDCIGACLYRLFSTGHC